MMTLPTMVVALSRTAFGGVPSPTVRRRSRWAPPTGRWSGGRSSRRHASGIAAAVTLAVGRALGESIAVAMVIGNRPAIPHSLARARCDPRLGDRQPVRRGVPGIGTSSVIALGAVLLLLTVAVNAGGQALLRRGVGVADCCGSGARSYERVRPCRWRWTAPVPDLGLPGPTAPVVRDSARRSTLRRRRIGGPAMQTSACIAVAIGLAPLVALLCCHHLPQGPAR